MDMGQLTVTLPGLRMKNPIMPASGTFGFGDMYQDLYNYNKLGALVLKSTTEHPRKGNEDPKFHPLRSGVLNAVGLKNPGVDKVISDKLPKLAHYETPIIASWAESYSDLSLTKAGISILHGPHQGAQKLSNIICLFLEI